MKKYKLLVTGGTFDHFHKGHESFLLAQFALSEKVLIGLTSDAYMQNYKEKNGENYKTRLHHLHAFLVSQNLDKHAEIAEIHDAYIPLIWDSYHIEAIAATKDTKVGAENINTKRKQEGKSILSVEIIQELTAEDGKEISSSRIRDGEIDRNGNVYIIPEWLLQTVYLPQDLRSKLTKPMGDEFASIEEVLQEKKLQEEQVIAVGDITTKVLGEKSFRPHVVVVDLKVQRKEFFSSLDQHGLQDYTVISFDNPAGSLTPALFTSAKKIIHNKQKTVVYIHGEEDLAVLPFVLAAPLGHTIIYGQPNKGVVVLEVTEEKKNSAKKLVEQFQTSAT